VEKRRRNPMVSTLKYASIGIDEVISSKYRLEASVYNVEARNAKELLKSCGWEIKNICGENGIATAYHKGRFKRVFVEKSDLPIFQPSQILEIFPKPYKYISSLTKTDIDALRVNFGQILMSCSGTIGKCSIVSRTMANNIFSHDLLRINANMEGDIGYLYTFLQTSIGQTLVITNNYGAVIDHIEPEHLEYVPIPYATYDIRHKIHMLIMQSFEARDKSNEMIQAAEDCLLAALNLPPIGNILPDLFKPNAEVKTFIVKLNDLNNRIDGSYHNPLVDKILDYFFDSGAIVAPLKEYATNITMPGIFKRIYVNEEDGVPFLGTNDILELNPRVEKFLSKTGHKQLIEKQLSVKENTILMTDRGTIGNVQLVPKYYEEEHWTVSQNSIRIIPNSSSIAGYLYIFLNSDYGKVLSKRETYGAVIDMVDPNNVGQIPVAMLHDENKVKNINDLALEANKLRVQAYMLEKEAIDIMNKEVLVSSLGRP
jgi:type I restriction enzyme, S subunit